MVVRSYVPRPTCDRHSPNLSVPGRTLSNMSTSTSTINENAVNDVSDVFGDPVSYLAALGIEAEVVAETTLPAAA